MITHRLPALVVVAAVSLLVAGPISAHNGVDPWPDEGHFAGDLRCRPRSVLATAS